jgi:sialidase-1
MRLVLLLLLSFAAACASGASPPMVFTLASAKDFIVSGGAAIVSNPLLNLRSGNPQAHTVAAVAIALPPGAVVSSLTFSYRYCFGFGTTGLGANFTLQIAKKIAYASPAFTDHPYSKSNPVYSPSVNVTLEKLSISVPDSGVSRIEFDFANNARNVQLLLPISVAITCAGGSSCVKPTPAPLPTPVPPPTPAPTPAPGFIDLFHQLDSRLPRGYYRIPSLISTSNGTLLAIINGRFHRTDSTPNIVYMRRSHDDGNTWEEAVPILADPNNRTEYGGAPVLDPTTGTVHFIHNAANGHGCSGCELLITSSADNGATWSKAAPLNVSKSQPPNATWGGGLASGITLTKGPHKGRLMVALRHDCGCGDLKASFVVYSDDHGKTWRGGEQMMLLPQFGGGWTEDQVAELQNGSVLLTSRNFFGKSSGQGARLFARSDDGGATWADNWTAYDLPDPFCEASVLSNPNIPGSLYFGNPSSSRGRRDNYSIHSSPDGGRTWNKSVVVYTGGSAYSDTAFTRNGSIAVFFEKDGYNTASFTVVPTLALH